MSYENLCEFVDDLERSGQLKRIGAAVDPRLEITEIADRVVKAGGPALLFENPKNSRFPLLINAFGTRERMARALGVDPVGSFDSDKAAGTGRTIRSISEDYLKLLEQSGDLSFLDKIMMLPQLKSLADALPKTVASGPCQEVVMDEPSFEPFPILTCWPQDGGPYITLPMVFTRDAETGQLNCGMYRMQIYDSKTSGMHWQIHKDGARHHQQRIARGERIDVAVALGGDPATIFASICPLPPNVNEMILAGLIRRKAVRMVQCKTNDLLVPAEAEIVFEGYVEPLERRREGPFGDHTGYYSLADDYPVFHLTCVTHRRDAIYPATIVGRPPMEDCFMGEAVEQLFLPVMQKMLPEIVDVHIPFAGVFHNLMLVAIDKRFPGHARKVMNGVWGMGQAMTTKVIVVLDKGVNLRDYGEVAWRALNHIDPERDAQFVLGPVDTLDHASRLPNYGSKVGIDATVKWPKEGFARPWPDEIKMTDDVKKRIDAIWGQLGLT